MGIHDEIFDKLGKVLALMDPQYGFVGLKRQPVMN